ncbi:hypothetical protein [Mycoplasma sp. ATU-Cv-508]|uniref:hypothetical protein n=1 Tax=Mycoplasma sp. ATU-Cv-508 TaxID=2048001 RepID=UPI001F36B131
MYSTKFFALGGMQEIGKAMLVVEYRDEIAIMDAGIRFTNSMETGVSGIIPITLISKRTLLKLSVFSLPTDTKTTLAACPTYFSKLT